MSKYICENVFVPLRSGPSHRAEMLSQIVFGEKYAIVGEAGKWIKIETEFDKFTGWLDLDHLQHCPEKSGSRSYVINKALPCFKKDKSRMVLEPGSEIYDPDFTSFTFMAGENIFHASDDFNKSYVSANESLTDTALRFINSPYIWGGRIPSGIDCSGLTQLVFKIHGIAIPRNSAQQAEIGDSVNMINDARPGDLVFFDNERGIITHVGMVFSEGLVIHASGRVRIDNLDHQGIFKPETGKYSHHLRLIKRIK
ncbi:MAG TPA: C40 family peptidase [Bacteroidales bacterium]|nr:C40 family peptidase [Bacteroidales bacterium]